MLAFNSIQTQISINETINSMVQAQSISFDTNRIYYTYGPEDSIYNRIYDNRFDYPNPLARLHRNDKNRQAIKGGHDQ